MDFNSLSGPCAFSVVSCFLIGNVDKFTDIYTDFSIAGCALYTSSASQHSATDLCGAVTLFATTYIVDFAYLCGLSHYWSNGFYGFDLDNLYYLVLLTDGIHFYFFGRAIYFLSNSLGDLLLLDLDSYPNVRCCLIYLDLYALRLLFVITLWTFYVILALLYFQRLLLGRFISLVSRTRRTIGRRFLGCPMRRGRVSCYPCCIP